MRPIQRQKDTFAYRVAGSADDVLAEWETQSRKDFGRLTPAAPEHKVIRCPKCLGQGWDNVNDRPCRTCEATGWGRSLPRDKVTRSITPYANRLEKALYQEFMEWWPTSETAKTRTPSTSGTGWRFHPKEPITHWLNVEDFFKERHPDAATGSELGMEQITPKMKRLEMDAPFTPEELDRMGFVANGNVKTQAMLNLHNKLQGRNFTTTKDRRRYYELMLKHVGPGAQRTSASNRTVPLSPSPDTDSVVYGLSSEFDEWAKANNKGNPYDDRYLAMPIEQYAKAVPRNWKPRGPVGYWPNIEEFMKEKYPAAHRGLSMGFEDADPLLDTVPEDLHNLDWLAGKEPYETGPDAVAKHGYDPREVAATLLLLHNDTHPGRENYLKTDQARLLDIAQKRMKMQRAYEERQKVAASPHATGEWFVPGRRKPAKPVEPLSHPIVDKIGKEFDDWAKEYGVGNPNDHPDSEGFWGQPRGPIGYWPNVEDFLEEHYPEAHRGLLMGLEGATALRDYGRPLNESVIQVRSIPEWNYHPPLPEVAEYETGPHAEAQHGYDPKEVVTALLLLHNQTHPNRWEMVNTDRDVLMDIAQKRHKMQQAYEERMKQKVTAALHYAQQVLAMPWQDWSDKINDSTEWLDGPGCTSGTCGKTNVYHIMHRPGTSFLNYDHKSVEVTTDDGPVSVPYLAINTIHVDPNYRKDGVAEALMRRLHDDHPGVFINPGPMTDDGRALLHGLTEKIPESHELIIGRVAMPALTLPRNVAIKRHQYRDHSTLKNEVLTQNGAAILWRALDGALPGEHLYVARDKDGRIHGVGKAMDIGTHHAISDLYTSLDAPPSTGTKILRTIAQQAKKKGQGLFLTNMLPSARRYWEAMGAVTKPDSPHAEFTPESHQALIDRNTIEAPHTEPDSDFGLMHGVSEDVRKPGSIEQFIGAWRTQNRWQDRMEARESGRPAVRDRVCPSCNNEMAICANCNNTGYVPRPAEEPAPHDPDAWQRQPFRLTAQRSWHQHLASFNRLSAELSDADAAMLYDHMQKLFQPITPSGKWYHVSPHALPDGTDLRPGGGDSTSQSFYDDGWGEDTGTLTDMGQGRTGHVWLTPDLDDAHFWSAALNAPHIYEVDPHEDPRPWNGTGTDGWVVPGAKIRRKVIA